MSPAQIQTDHDILMRLDEKVDGMHENLNAIHDQVKFTNGKVRKIILALVLIGGIVIGQTFTNAHDVISLLVQAL